MSSELDPWLGIEHDIIEIADSPLLDVRRGSPVLFLGMLERSRLRGIKGGRRGPLVRVSHQFAGVGCDMLHAEGFVLQPRPSAFAAMQLIEATWRETSMGAFRTQLDDIELYRSQLRSTLHPRADCNSSYHLLAEAVYPLDPSVDVLREICTDDLPDDLDDLLEFESGASRLRGVVDRWACLILTENSD